MPEVDAIGQRLESRAHQKHRLAGDTLRRYAAIKFSELLRSTSRHSIAGPPATELGASESEWLQQSVGFGP